MNCVNYKNKDVQELAEELNLHPALAAAKIAVWQRNNGVDKWPTKEDLLGKSSINYTLKAFNYQ